MKLTEHFSLEELTFSDWGLHHGVDNTPSDHQGSKLLWLANWLEVVRQVTGPLHVNSAFRCAVVNTGVGGQDNSQHMACEAADLRSLLSPTPHTPYHLCELVLEAEQVKFDQLIYEFGAWMHVSFAPIGRTPRREVLTITKLGVRRGLHQGV